MSNQMDDEKFEDFLQREAQSYNAPPANVPRDEMFAAISAARAAGRKPQAGGRTPRLAWIGMAATLLIGVAIGKFALDKPAAPAAAPVIARSTAQDTSAGSYTIAASTELARAEALLTAYGAASHEAGVDKQLSTWARDVLENTRLLLDSPAAADPARRKLLQDLELVLVQMVQRSPTAGASDERAQIDRSMERTQVLTRLRSALPAGRNN